MVPIIGYFKLCANVVIVDELRNPYVTMSGKYFGGLKHSEERSFGASPGKSIARLHSCGSDSSEERVLGKIIQSSRGH